MGETTRKRAIAFSIFGAWLVVVLWASWNHAVWRDEVRALSKALDGDSLLAMVRGLHTDGHPALWYLLLRGAHLLLPWPEVLPALSLAIAAAAALLLVLYSPFEWWVNALILAGKAFLFEYSVVARNYGITTLLLFLLAVLYPRRRDRGPVLGVLLFLLANCNAQSVLLAGGFLLFWLIDIGLEDRAKRARSLVTYAWNAAIAAAGVGVCLLTVLPAPHYLTPLQNPANTPVAAGAVAPDAGLSPVWKAVLLPGNTFSQLTDNSQEPGSYGASADFSASRLLLSAILFGSTLGLVRVPSAFWAALGTLLGFSLFFVVVYRGFYRHEALWLSFLIVCYWLAQAKPGAPAAADSGAWRVLSGRVSTAGWGLFLLLMALQAQLGVTRVYAATVDGPPFSCSRDLADLVDSRPELHDAILLADPDYLLESAPYYLKNPTYYLRDGRFGTFTRIRGSLVRLTLEDVLTNARRLHAETNKPVLILLGHPLDPDFPERIYQEAHQWEFEVTPPQAREFSHATQLVQSFPTALTDESFDVYLLK